MVKTTCDEPCNKVLSLLTIKNIIIHKNSQNTLNIISYRGYLCYVSIAIHFRL